MYWIPNLYRADEKNLLQPLACLYTLLARYDAWNDIILPIFMFHEDCLLIYNFLLIKLAEFHKKNAKTIGEFIPTQV